jgi:hypothetical protein
MPFLYAAWVGRGNASLRGDCLEAEWICLVSSQGHVQRTAKESPAETLCNPEASRIMNKLDVHAIPEMRSGLLMGVGVECAEIYQIRAHLTDVPVFE